MPNEVTACFIDSALGEPVMSQADSLTGSSRIFRLENYYSNDTFVYGTQEEFLWRTGIDVNRRIDWQDANGTWHYRSHDGPVDWYGDTVANPTVDPLGVCFLAERRSRYGDTVANPTVDPQGMPNPAGRGWADSMYYRSQCTVTPISVPTTISGSLASTDCRSSLRGNLDRYADRYSFIGTAGQQVAIALSSSAFDTYLYLVPPSGSTVGDDDGGGGTNSRIPAGSGYYTLPVSGTYIIEVTSYSANATGSYTLTVTRNTTCTYSITPTSRSFTASAGTGTISVTAGTGCSWTAASNAGWITITSGSSGSGNGTVYYSVAANTSTSSRTGTITVAGQTHTVTQSGSAGCTVTAIGVPTTVSGSLSTTDCRSPIRGTSYYADRYSFSGTAGQQVAITLSSSSFDTYLYLVPPSGTTQSNDDCSGTNSRIPCGTTWYTLPVSGTYVVEVTSYNANAIGSYTLSTSRP